MAADGYLKDPASVPDVSVLALRLVLLRDGKLADVNAAVAGIGDEAALAWEYATRVRRDHPLVIAAAAAAGIDAAALDAYFIAALSAAPAA